MCRQVFWTRHPKKTTHKLFSVVKLLCVVLDFGQAEMVGV